MLRLVCPGHFLPFAFVDPSSTALTPFWDSQNGYWASSEATITSKLGYTYPEFNGLNMGNPSAVQMRSRKLSTNCTAVLFSTHSARPVPARPTSWPPGLWLLVPVTLRPPVQVRVKFPPPPHLLQVEMPLFPSGPLTQLAPLLSTASTTGLPASGLRSTRLQAASPF